MNPKNLTRRELLESLLAGATISASGLIMPSLAYAKPGEFDVSYLWTPSLEGALDYMDDVGRILGPGVREDLHVVKGNSGNFGVIYERDGDRDSTSVVARKHSKILTSSDLDSATVVEHEGFHDLYNISYGVGPNLGAQKNNFSTIVKMLGSGVEKNLIIEETSSGNYALVYKRFGDLESSRQVAARHDKLLSSSGIDASVIKENNNEQVFGESSHLDEVVERERQVTTPTQPRTTPRSTSSSSNLEQQIEDYIGGLRRSGRIASNERTAWSVYDFNSGQKLVSINEDVPLQCASMVKPYIALAFFREVERKRFIYGSKSKSNMEAMIQRSNNASTNWVIDQVGGPNAVQKILTNHYGNIFQNTSIVEKIPGGGRTYRNKSSAHDYSRFLFNLWNNNLPNSREMRRLMALPGRDRIYSGAKKVPQGTLVYNKTGSTARLIGDMGILVARDSDGRRYPYTMIGIVEKSSRASNYGSFASSRGNVIREVSNLSYLDMKKRYDLV